MNKNENTANEKKRGYLQDEILKDRLTRLLPGKDLQKIVRLFPYLDYCIKNQGFFDINKMDADEVDILSTLEQKRLVEIESERVKSISKPFYNLIQDVLYNAYVCLK